MGFAQICPDIKCPRVAVWIWTISHCSFNNFLSFCEKHVPQLLAWLLVTRPPIWPLHPRASPYIPLYLQNYRCWIWRETIFDFERGQSWKWFFPLFVSDGLIKLWCISGKCNQVALNKDGSYIVYCMKKQRIELQTISTSVCNVSNECWEQLQSGIPWSKRDILQATLDALGRSEHVPGNIVTMCWNKLKLN